MRCEHPAYRDSVKSGESYPENIAPDVRTEWAVETPDGQLLRCVNLYWKHYPGRSQTFRLSAALPRRSPARPPAECGARLPSENGGRQWGGPPVGGGARYVAGCCNEARPVPEGDRVRC